MKRQFLESLAVLSLSLLVLAHPDLTQTYAAYLTVSLQGLSINLPVNPIKQSKATSCGEAVIAMAYNYAYPETTMEERVILTYAEMQGYYTEMKAPFTSPANMVKITHHYTKNYSTGTVSNSDQGLTLLREKLQRGTPVIIDVFARLDNPTSGAHFILVTGVSVAPDNKYAITVYYNEPLTGKNRSSPWFGDEGIWNAWRHNSDPGGSGWWLSFPSPAVLTPINGTGNGSKMN
jgi:hypothetical protein